MNTVPTKEEFTPEEEALIHALGAEELPELDTQAILSGAIVRGRRMRGRRRAAIVAAVALLLALSVLVYSVVNGPSRAVHADPLGPVQTTVPTSSTSGPTVSPTRSSSTPKRSSSADPADPANWLAVMQGGGWKAYPRGDEHGINQAYFNKEMSKGRWVDATPIWVPESEWAEFQQQYLDGRMVATTTLAGDVADVIVITEAGLPDQYVVAAPVKNGYALVFSLLNGDPPPTLQETLDAAAFVQRR